MTRLANAFEPLSRGLFAGVATIVGEAGMGKSHLASEFLAQLSSPDGVAGVRIPGMQFFVCQADEILRGSLNPFQYWLNSYFSLSSVQGAGARRTAFDRQLDSLMLSIEDGELAAELQRTRSALGALVNIRWDGSLYERLSPELRHENSLNALVNLIRVESLRRPTILLLEDAHWLDEDSENFLVMLTRSAKDMSLALLVTSRLELAASAVDQTISLTTVDLQSLGPEALKAFVRQQMGQEPAPELLEFLAERTNGNPLFVEQLLHHVEANDLLHLRDGQLDLAQSAMNVIPDNVRSLLVARLDRLAPATRDMVQRAAVIGREFSGDILQHMSSSERAAPELMSDATREGIWSPVQEDRFLFRHALLREAAYRMQVRSRRRELHRQAAHAFEWWHSQEPSRQPRFAEIAYHFDKAEAAPEAVRYYGRAGEQASESFGNNDALTYFSRALELAQPAELETRYELLMGREAILQRTGQREQQEPDLDALAELAEMAAEPAWHYDILLRRSAYEMVMGRYEAARGYAESSVAGAVAARDTLAEARAYHRWGRVLWQQGHYRDAEPLLISALRLAREYGSTLEEADCLYELGVIRYFQAELASSQRYLDRARDAFQEMDNRQGELRCLSLGAAIAYSVGRYDGMRTAYYNAVELSREIGSRYSESHMLAQLGGSLFTVGLFDEAQEQLHGSLNICREIGDRENEIDAQDTLGLIEHFRGDWDAAHNHFREALDLEETIHYHRSRGFILTHLGYLNIERGEYELASGSLQEALDIRRQLGDDGAQMDTIGGLALLALRKGDLPHALRHASYLATRLESRGSVGVEFPVLLYLVAYRVFRVAGAQGSAHNATATQMLEAGHAILRERSEAIVDNDDRQMFLEQLPFNRELLEAWHREQRGH